MKKVILLLLVVITAVSAETQIKDPAVSRAWWPAVKSYIDAKSQGLIVTIPAPFSSMGYSSSHSADTLVIFTPVSTMETQSVTVYSPNFSLPDSTLYLIAAHGTRDTLVVIDSTGNGSLQSWTGTAAFEFSAAEPCTLIYSLGADTAYIENPLIIFQWKNKE